MASPIRVTEFTDPTCSWAWGSEPKVRRLGWCHGRVLEWRRVMGGLLAPDWRGDHGVTDPTYYTNPKYLRRSMQYHATVSETTGMPFPGRLEWLPFSSHEACLAVKAAELQGHDQAGRLLRRLREDWYVFGRPPGTRRQTLDSAASVAGIDVARMERDLDDRATEAAFLADWEEHRNPNEYVLGLDDDRVGYGAARPHRGRTRYGLPTLIFTGPGGERTVAGWRPWEDYEGALRAVAGAEGLPPARPLPAPERW
ncbi:MAG: DsbA family oxidoreductase [Acidimicrobiia bacterium]